MWLLFNKEQQRRIIGMLLIHNTKDRKHTVLLCCSSGLGGLACNKCAGRYNHQSYKGDGSTLAVLLENSHKALEAEEALHFQFHKDITTATKKRNVTSISWLYHLLEEMGNKVAKSAQVTEKSLGTLGSSSGQKQTNHFLHGISTYILLQQLLSKVQEAFYCHIRYTW